MEQRIVTERTALRVAFVNDSYSKPCVYEGRFPDAFPSCRGRYYWLDFSVLALSLLFPDRPFRFLSTRRYFPDNVTRISKPLQSEIGMVSIWTQSSVVLCPSVKSSIYTPCTGGRRPCGPCPTLHSLRARHHDFPQSHLPQSHQSQRPHRRLSQGSPSTPPASEHPQPRHGLHLFRLHSRRFPHLRSRSQGIKYHSLTLPPKWPTLQLIGLAHNEKRDLPIRRA